VQVETRLVDILSRKLEASQSKRKMAVLDEASRMIRKAEEADRRLVKCNATCKTVLKSQQELPLPRRFLEPAAFPASDQQIETDY